MAKIFGILILLAGSFGFVIRATLILRTRTYTTRGTTGDQTKGYVAYAVANYMMGAFMLVALLYALIFDGRTLCTMEIGGTQIDTPVCKFA